MISRRTQLIGGFAATALGLFIGVMIHAHPEGLRAPAWVAYVAGSAFALAGLSASSCTVRYDPGPSHNMAIAGGVLRHRRCGSH